MAAFAEQQSRLRRTRASAGYRPGMRPLLLILHITFAGLVDGDARSHDITQLSQNSCPSLAIAPDVEETGFLSTGNKYSALLHACSQIRGGRLGRNRYTQLKNTTETKDEDHLLSPEKAKKKIDYTKSPYSFSLFQENDGHETDPDRIPDRYLAMQNNKRDKAKKALEGTLAWRKENAIDTILARPNPKFDVCKKVFPHYFCGRDDTDRVILLQRPGLIDLKLAKANSLTGEDLLWHYVYEMEYLWKILEPASDATMTSVIDLTGINLSILRKPELLSVVNLFCSTMDAHFPQRAHKTLLINAPKWFGAIYKLISPLLRESTKEKITILSKGKKQEEAIRDLLSKECSISGDQKMEDLPPAQMEQDLRTFVSDRLLESDEIMQVVIN